MQDVYESLDCGRACCGFGIRGRQYLHFPASEKAARLFAALVVIALRRFGAFFYRKIPYSLGGRIVPTHSMQVMSGRDCRSMSDRRCLWQS
eukprot:scaffold547_cov384-Prasinococcus_capsulatus_cf.AAC.18